MSCNLFVFNPFLKFYLLALFLALLWLHRVLLSPRQQPLFQVWAALLCHVHCPLFVCVAHMMESVAVQSAMYSRLNDKKQSSYSTKLLPFLTSDLWWTAIMLINVFVSAGDCFLPDFIRQTWWVALLHPENQVHTSKPASRRWGRHSTPVTRRSFLFQAKEWQHHPLQQEEGEVQEGRILLEEKEGWKNDERRPHEAEGPGHGGQPLHGPPCRTLTVTASTAGGERIHYYTFTPCKPPKYHLHHNFTRFSILAFYVFN